MNSTDKQNKNKKKRNNYFVYDFVKITGIIPAFLWMRAKIIRVGEKKPKRIKGGALISANHVSFADPILIHCVFWYRRLHFLAPTDLFNTKLKGWFFSQLHCIPVDKENFSVNSFHEVCDDLNAEKLVAIFPEGQVNRTGEQLLGFKSGVVLMAYKCNKPIVPMYIIPVEKWYKRRVVLLSDPINVRELCGKMPSMEDCKKISELLREKEMELMEYYRTNVEKKGAKTNGAKQ